MHQFNYHYDWDRTKALANLKKHGISFELASKIFEDPFAMTLFDHENSDAKEDRWITIGLVHGQIYLAVVHTYRQENAEHATIRLISARHATSNEVKAYQGD